MSVQGLQNPYERLQILPTTMNWRGTWLITQTYFKNDVVISPINGASYILVGKTALNGGADPSASANFIELSPLSTGVQGITAGAAISISGPANNPTITNDGVRTVDGDGVTIVVDNTNPNNPVISSNSITILQGGAGITINNANPQIPVVSNTGVRQIVAADASVSVSNPTGIVSISSNGLISVLAGTGISVTGDQQNPEIGNTGVVSLAVGDGLSSTGGVNPTISNTGVLSVTAGDSSIVVTGTPQNVILRTTAPVLTRIFSFNFGFPNDFNARAPGAVQIINGVTPNTPNIFTDYLASGAPDPNGIFMIDLSSIILLFTTATDPTVVQNVVSVGFSNGPNEYVSSTVLNDTYLIIGIPYSLVRGLTAALGTVYFNVADARAAGLTSLTQLRIFNNTNGTMILQNTEVVFNGTYYPDGLQ